MSVVSACNCTLLSHALTYKAKHERQTDRQTANTYGTDTEHQSCHKVVRLCFKIGYIGISLHFGPQSVALPTSTLCLGPTRAHHVTVGRQGDKSGLPGHCLNALIFSPALHGELEPQSKHNPQDMQPYGSGADLRVNKTVVRLQYSSEA